MDERNLHGNGWSGEREEQEYPRGEEGSRQQEEGTRPCPVWNTRGWAYDFYMAGLLVLAFVIDQVTKAWVRGNIVLGSSVPQEGFFRISHTYNTGSAFGLFPNQTFLLVLASIAGIGILIVFFRNQSIPPFWLRTSLGLELGGAAGNLVDRITLGHVTDFVDIGPWPVFNVADASIVTGIGLLAWFMLRTPKNRRLRGREGTPADSASRNPQAFSSSKQED